MVGKHVWMGKTYPSSRSISSNIVVVVDLAGARVRAIDTESAAGARVTEHIPAHSGKIVYI